MTPGDADPGPAEARIAPWLSVPDGPRALQWYAVALGAAERYRLEDDGRVVVARLAIGAGEFWFGEDRGADRGGPIRMIVTVQDPQALFARAIQAGATEVFAVAEQHGWRVGRLADPFGHHWEIGTELSG
jgi:PhnB protein